MKTAAQNAAAALADATQPGMRWRAYSSKAMNQSFRGRTDAALATLAREDSALPEWAEAQGASVETQFYMNREDFDAAIDTAQLIEAKAKDLYASGMSVFLRFEALALQGRGDEADAVYSGFEAGLKWLPPGLLGSREHALRGWFLDVADYSKSVTSAGGLDRMARVDEAVPRRPTPTTHRHRALPLPR